MTQQMHDVSMLSDEEVTIEGETYELEEGDIVSLSFKTARNYVNQFGIAEFHGDKYPVRDDQYLEEVGPTGETVQVEEDPSDEGDSDGDGEPASEAYLWLDDRTVDEVREDIEDVEDVEFLENLYDEAERKGAADAIEAALEEESEADDEGEESEDEEE